MMSMEVRGGVMRSVGRGGGDESERDRWFGVESCRLFLVLVCLEFFFFSSLQRRRCWGHVIAVHRDRMKQAVRVEDLIFLIGGGERRCKYLRDREYSLVPLHA